LEIFSLYAQNVSISIAVNSGSKYESAKEKGAAHLLAAAGFAGTKERSGLRLMRDIENAGFIVDATADREQIIYSIKALPDAAGSALTTLAEAVFSPPSRDYVVSLPAISSLLVTHHCLRSPSESRPLPSASKELNAAHTKLSQMSAHSLPFLYRFLTSTSSSTRPPTVREALSAPAPSLSTSASSTPKTCSPSEPDNSSPRMSL
jgi:hypothetical protein